MLVPSRERGGGETFTLTLSALPQQEKEKAAAVTQRGDTVPSVAAKTKISRYVNSRVSCRRSDQQQQQPEQEGAQTSF